MVRKSEIIAEEKISEAEYFFLHVDKKIAKETNRKTIFAILIGSGIAIALLILKFGFGIN